MKIIKEITHSVAKFNSDEYGEGIFEGSFEDCQEFQEANEESFNDEGYYLQIIELK